ncbi:hypothetical protein BJF79_30630 [Actinomadura sp. CNU-125]|uniref:DUF1444 family protein n=1 Tax=Actinomadura sp. CNU-125 TaxID=1904961 RepID=UPI000964DD75|nr:DUF1444 family protein [Actinomadura sp. CNU-125]OLT36733.1 hypothetical protein BJF79_30630 [Actinomadura sp. CNU-125]
MTDPSLIVPLMKARVPAEVQLEFPLPSDEEPVRDAFAGELYVTYALEHADESAPSGRRYEHVAPRHCAELGVEPGGLRARAVLNLRDRRPELGLNWYPDVRAVTVTVGGLEASLLLDDGFLDKLAQDVEGDLVVAAPARDVFVASGTGHPEGVDKLRWAIAQVWARERSDADPAWDAPASALLGHELLVRRSGAWDILTTVS